MKLKKADVPVKPGAIKPDEQQAEMLSGLLGKMMNRRSALDGDNDAENAESDWSDDDEAVVAAAPAHRGATDAFDDMFAGLTVASAALPPPPSDEPAYPMMDMDDESGPESEAEERIAGAAAAAIDVLGSSSQVAAALPTLNDALQGSPDENVPEPRVVRAEPEAESQRRQPVQVCISFINIT